MRIVKLHGGSYGSEPQKDAWRYLMEWRRLPKGPQQARQTQMVSLWLSQFWAASPRQMHLAFAASLHAGRGLQHKFLLQLLCPQHHEAIHSRQVDQKKQLLPSCCEQDIDHDLEWLKGKGTCTPDARSLRLDVVAQHWPALLAAFHAPAPAKPPSRSACLALRCASGLGQGLLSLSRLKRFFQRHHVIMATAD